MKQTGHSESKTFDRYLNVDADIARQVAQVLDMAAALKQQQREPEFTTSEAVN